ncbi:MAG: hypothetical protein JKY48_10445 [Flavobacteriales bacterium]|nr:hypothetical protein [Flavobacteriales bacterium]
MYDNIIGHGLLDYIVVLTFVLYAIYAALTRTHRILYILPAAVSFFFFIQVGPLITPDKVVPFIFLVFVMFRYGVGYFKIPYTSLSKWLLGVFFMICIAFFIGGFYTQYYGNLINSPHLSNRLYIQLIGYANSIFIFIIVRRECILQNNIYRLLKSFIWTTSILAIYGVYQYYADQFGLPYRGMIRSASIVDYAHLKIGEESFFRVNSLASEPKRLTYFIVIGVIILIKYKDYFFGKIGKIMTVALIVAHLLVLWWTYSTSIYISLAVFIGGLMFYVLFLNYNRRLMRTLVVASLIGVGGYFSQQQNLNKLYENRVDEQLENEDVRSEVKGVDYLQSYPGLFIFGIGPGMYNFALAIEYPGKAGLSPLGEILIPFNSAFLTYVYDFGILGCFIIIFHC